MVFAGLFVAGIVLGDKPALWVWGIVVLYYMVTGIRFLRLQRGKRQSSAVDRLLFLAPLFLLLGFGVMREARATYEGRQKAFTECMEAGRELLVRGTIRHIRITETGVRLELEQAQAASYGKTETLYRPVGTLLVYGEGMQAENGMLKIGQQVFVYGKGSTFSDATNPGAFSPKQYYFSMGITGAIQGSMIRITNFSYRRLTQALFQAKQALVENYVTYLGKEGAGVISSMLLGERALLSEETKEQYRQGGISHILAISGLHVSLLGSALYGLLRRTILGRNGAIPVACLCVVLYGNFVEAGTSTKRAVIMFILMLLAAALGRTYDTLSAMAVSMVLILWKNPGALYTAAFQLSYGAAYGASVMALLLREKEKERSPEEKALFTARYRDDRWFRLRTSLGKRCKEMFVFGIAIQAVTFPITVYHFFEYPVYGMLLNPVVVPLMTILLLCGLLSGLCGLAVPWLGYFFGGGTCAILWLYEALCSLVSKLPFSLCLVGRPLLIQIGLYFGFLVFVIVFKKNRKNILWLLLLPVCLLPLPAASLEVAFLDVGQGDGIVIRERNGAVLMIDGGSTSVQGVGEKCMLPYLKAKGIRVIDCAFISHADSDHISGISEILKAMPVRSAYRESAAGYTGVPVIKKLALPDVKEPDALYESLVELAKEKEVEVLFLTAGDRMTVGENLVLSCLAPEEAYSYPDKNAASMVLLASYGQFDVLLTGDTTKESEERMLAAVPPEVIPFAEVEVLKVAHHGSYTSTSEELIQAIQPLISVISCGKDNSYGHPHTETLERLYSAGSLVYRTDESGCVTIKVRNDGKLTAEGWAERN